MPSAVGTEQAPVAFLLMNDAEFRFSSTVRARLPGRIEGRFGQAARCAGHKDFHRLRDHHIQHIRRQAVFLREQDQRFRLMREAGLAQAADASGLERTAHRLHLFPRAGEALGNGFEHCRRNGSGFFRAYGQLLKSEHRKAVQRLGFPRQRVGIKQLAARQRSGVNARITAACSGWMRPVQSADGAGAVSSYIGNPLELEQNDF